MERLRFEECKNCKDWTGCITDCLDTCGKPLDALEEFNKYKEIGTVEEFKMALENVKTLSSMYEKLSDQEVAEYHRLSEYEGLEEQRKLLKLPCAVGDTVYEVQELRKRIQPYTIIAIHISNCGNLYGWELKDGKGVYSNVNGFSEYDLGKTVFLTPKEAEAALKEISD